MCDPLRVWKVSRRPDMIVVGMRVDEVGDGLVGHLLNRCGQLIGERRRRVDDNDAVRWDDKTGLDEAGDHDVSSVTGPLEPISLCGVLRWACLLGERQEGLREGCTRALHQFLLV